MDPRSSLFSLEQQLGAQQSLLRSGGGGGYGTTQPLGGAFPPLQGFGGFADRGSARQELSSLSHLAAPPPMHSLSSGQGYYTVESLEGGTVAGGDVLAGRPPLLMQDGDRNAGLAQLGYGSGILSSTTAAQSGLGKSFPSSMQGIGSAGDSAPYFGSRMPQEVEAGRAGLLRLDTSGKPYLHHSQQGLVPVSGVYEDLGPSRLPLGPELELRRRNELLTALEQRRDLEYEARVREASREALIREARITEVRLERAKFERAQFERAQLERASRIRESQLSMLREQKVPDRRVSLPFRRDEGPLSLSKRTGTGLKRFWCSVCQLDCNTSFNLKSHLGGKRHKLKLQEEAEKKSGKTREKKENEKAEDEGSKPELAKDEVNEAKDSETTNGKADEEVTEAVEVVTEVEIVNEAENMKKRSLSDDTEAGANKRLKNAESASEGADSDGLAEKPERPPRKVEKCDVCNVTCIGKVDLEAHLKGKKHANNLRRLQGSVPDMDNEKAAQVEPTSTEEAANS